MRLRVFISWSGERSRLMADAMAGWLPRVLQASAPWMSNQIEKGDRWSQRIGEKLSDYDVGIVCVTPENTTAPWLLFEAGALSRTLGSARVCPLLLGISPTDVEGPLAQFQATVLEKDDLFELVRTLNTQLGDEALKESVLRDAFSREWQPLERKVKRLADAVIPATAVTVPSVIRSFARYGLPEPALGSAAYFAEGFESHGLYSTVCDVASRQLNVFGRKNRKLFDKEHSTFFDSLGSRLDEGFDFRCLFLDPEAPSHILLAAHQDEDFLDDLNESVERAHETLSDADIDPETHLRLYRIQRNASLILVDDAVLYAPIKLTEDGRARALTKCAFTVVNSNSHLGQSLAEDFETIWSSARPLSLKP